ncbi:MAG: PEP-CTERM sorting domain-containing protein [Deltaproteobacteria bacterium]|nr:PEP-CTERM sorting domain-containing protein [Deltaproteobacteria bacterium]
MKKKILAGLATGLMMIGTAGMAQAIPYGFTVVEDNSPLNPAGQLQVDVTDEGGGITLFAFSNTGNIQSTIADIYFDWEATSTLTFAGYDSTGDVSFDHFASPSDLSGGQTIDFTADWSTDADPPPGTNQNGIDNWTAGIQDTLTIAFTGSSFNAILSALNSEDFRIGLHLQGLTDGESESYVTGGGPAPVPEPATMLLFGTGLAGLSGYFRKKRSA